MNSPPSGFTTHELSPGFVYYSGQVPDHLVIAGQAFDDLWDMKPTQHPRVVLKGRSYVSPRWHQAFGQDYSFAGITSVALPVPPILAPILNWTASTIDGRINGILVNWYDGAAEHRIPQHKDSPVMRIPDCPIVTVSLGASRTFLMHVRNRTHALRVNAGDVVVIPGETNRRHAHSVPHLTGDQGRRISVTLRGFFTDPGQAVAAGVPTSTETS